MQKAQSAACIFNSRLRRRRRSFAAREGAILDIIVDLRPESPTFLEHVAVELSEENYRAFYVPERFAHGYQVLRDDTDTSYQVGEFYTPGCEGGLRHDDPRLGLEWPLPLTAISDKDQIWKSLDEQEQQIRQRMASPSWSEFNK